MQDYNQGVVSKDENVIESAVVHWFTTIMYQ